MRASNFSLAHAVPEEADCSRASDEMGKDFNKSFE